MTGRVVRAGLPAVFLSVLIAIVGTFKAGVAAPVRAAGLVQNLRVEANREDSIFEGGRRIPFRARIERVSLGRHAGRVAATAYLTDYRVVGPGTRPVLFIFNGGPGAASAMLQFGMFGPRLVRLPADPNAHFGPPYSLFDNPDSLLDVADLVFIDPVGTGFGRLRDPRSQAQLWSTSGDADYVADIIRAWLRKNRREASPLYLVGESYGAERAASVAARLRCLAPAPRCEKQPVAGLVLISQSLAMANTTQRPGNIQGIAVGLPTVAALAWYHRLVQANGATVDRWVADAQTFASTEYVQAMFQGDRLAPADRIHIADRLSHFTGLPSDYFLDHDLEITKDAYRALPLKGKVMAVADGRFLADRVVGGAQPDAFEDLTTPAFQWAVRRSYGPAFRPAAPSRYILASGEIGSNWRYGEHLSYFTAYDYPGQLDGLLADSPELKILVTGGQYDTMASYGGDIFLTSHLHHARPGQVAIVRYEGGHMFYTDAGSRSRFARRLRTFLGF